LIALPSMSPLGILLATGPLWLARRLTGRPTGLEAAEFENQRNRSNGIAGGAGAARHLLNATREIEMLRFG
jgi:hypothetical protein